MMERLYVRSLSVTSHIKSGPDFDPVAQRLRGGEKRGRCGWCWGGSSSIKASLFTLDRERKSASEEKTRQRATGPHIWSYYKPAVLPRNSDIPAALQSRATHSLPHTQKSAASPNPLPKMTQHMRQINALHFLLTFDHQLPAATPKSRKKITESQTEAGRGRKSRLFLLSLAPSLSLTSKVS